MSIAPKNGLTEQAIAAARAEGAAEERAAWVKILSALQYQRGEDGWDRCVSCGSPRSRWCAEKCEFNAAIRARGAVKP